MTIPDSTNSTALYAATFFNSSWVRMIGGWRGGAPMVDESGKMKRGGDEIAMEVGNEGS